MPITVNNSTPLIHFKGAIPTRGGRINVDFGYRLVNEDVEVMQKDVAIVTLRPNRPPTDIHLSTTTVKANIPNGAVIGDFTVHDPDSGDGFFCDLVTDTRYRFKVFNNQLIHLAFTLTKPEYPLTVRCSDWLGDYVDKTFIITVEL